jgi:hypothetical protein
VPLSREKRGVYLGGDMNLITITFSIVMYFFVREVVEQMRARRLKKVQDDLVKQMERVLDIQTQLEKKDGLTRIK